MKQVLEQTFEQKVKSMSAKEIIMSMVEGLQNPVVRVDIDTFGEVIDNVCYGCAATNAICKISGKTFNIENIGYRDGRAEFINSDPYFLMEFEVAIDFLRSGYILIYNKKAQEACFAQIEDPKFELPKLTNNYTPKDLQQYINLANAQ